MNIKDLLSKNRLVVYWLLLGVLSMGLLAAWISRDLFEQSTFVLVGLLVLIAADIGAIVFENRANVSGRTLAFGVHSVLTTLIVLGIVGFVNWVSYKHPQKLDLTKDKLHTFSDQSKKIMKTLEKDVEAVFFGPKQEQEKNREILEKYRDLSSRFELEYVDPNLEPLRAQKLGLKKTTLLLRVGEGLSLREEKIAEFTEEKITNALIKLVKGKKQKLCVVVGHGEKEIKGREADGYEFVRAGLEEQTYTVEEWKTIEKPEIPVETCDSLAILGPTSPFFDQELAGIEKYLENGGRAIIALDINIKGKEYTPGLVKLLEKWHVKARHALIIDRTVRIPAIARVSSFSRSHPVTKEFSPVQEALRPVLFPNARPLEIRKGAHSELKVEAIGKTGAFPETFSQSDFKALAKNKLVFPPKAGDLKGPMTPMISVEGKFTKDSKIERKTRLIVMGSSMMGNNQFAQRGLNADLFLNSVSWLMEDENLIAIRPKDVEGGKIEMSRQMEESVFWLAVFIMPGFFVISGVVVWRRRKRL